MKKGIEIVIMSRERPTETLRAIQALSRVNFEAQTKIIVSDNPSERRKALVGLPGHVHHVIRDPSGSWNWHFNTIVSELEYEWCLITHDDDEILQALGTAFKNHSGDPNVSVITGLSQIVDSKEGIIFDVSYDRRIDSANIRRSAGPIYNDLAEHLYDLGTLFPASAMIIRTSVLRSHMPLEERFELTADFGLSILISRGNGVVFEGSQPVMNYNLHRNNSVFTDIAAGGIFPDFTITRIILLDKFKEFCTESRLTMLLRSIIISKILISAFNLSQRGATLREAVQSSSSLKSNKLKYFFMLIPIRLGPLAPLVRHIMRKKFGI